MGEKDGDAGVVVKRINLQFLSSAENYKVIWEGNGVRNGIGTKNLKLWRKAIIWKCWKVAVETVKPGESLKTWKTAFEREFPH